MEFKVGDYVTRNSYGNDIVFVIVDIKNGEAILKGYDLRLIANSPLSDLVLCDESMRKDDFLEELFKEDILDKIDRDDFFYLPPRILHLDGDSEYLEKCLQFYKNNRVMAYGKTLKEEELEKNVYRLLEEIKPDIIIHCAGSADIGKSVADPVMDYHGNVTITHNLLFALHKLGLSKTRFVFLSSAGVYGNPIALPVTEDMPLNPLSPYAVHKVMCEDLCKYFINNYGMNIKIARIFSAYGVGLRKQIFWDMYQKVKKTGILEMMGTGEESRDYIYIDDLVHVLMLIGLSDTCEEKIFNVANGQEITIKEAAGKFAEYIGVPVNKILFTGTVREGDPLNWCADISLIKKLGYVPSVTLAEGIAKYADWAGKTG